MTTANATRGATGNALVGGFDINGGGIQVDKTNVYTVIQEITAPHKEWEKLLLVHLINSSNEKINQLAKYLEQKNYNLFDDCYYNKKGNIYFIRIGGREFRIKNRKIVEIKDN